VALYVHKGDICAVEIISAVDHMLVYAVADFVKPPELAVDQHDVVAAVLYGDIRALHKPVGQLVTHTAHQPVVAEPACNKAPVTAGNRRAVHC
jgi:hypothetical protein